MRINALSREPSSEFCVVSPISQQLFVSRFRHGPEQFQSPLLCRAKFSPMKICCISLERGSFLLTLTYYFLVRGMPFLPSCNCSSLSVQPSHECLGPITTIGARNIPPDPISCPFRLALMQQGCSNTNQPSEEVQRK